MRSGQRIERGLSPEQERLASRATIYAIWLRTQELPQETIERYVTEAYPSVMARYRELLRCRHRREKAQ